MKQYLSPEQTAKLMELRFEKPRLLYFGNNTIGHYSYTLGELIEMLPKEITFDDTKYSIVISENEVYYYSWDFDVYFSIFDKHDELIDNLFDACVNLKEEGVI